MFDIAWSEVVVILVVAVVVIGPKDLPAVIKALREVGKKLHAVKQEIASALQDVEQDNKEGVRDTYALLKQESHAIERHIGYVMDLQGNRQDTYDISDLKQRAMRRLVSEEYPLESEDSSKKTLH